MLPYHRAFSALAAALAARGRPCVALEVTNADSSYGEFADTPLPAGAHVVTLFPNIDYLKLSAPHVARSVRQALHALGTVSVFAPAPAFAEGAGALHHKVDRGGTLFQMDDAWSATDHRGRLTRIVKRWFNGYVDGGFLPDKLHGRYFETLNIPADRQAYAVDAVADADEAGPSSDHERTDLLFVGRLIARKGLDSVLRAMAQLLPESPRLVVIGDGPERAGLQQLAIDLGISGCVVWLGRQSNAEARNWICASPNLGGAQRLRTVGFGHQRGAADGRAGAWFDDRGRPACRIACILDMDHVASSWRCRRLGGIVAACGVHR
ncbi:MAG: glycosyltransferase [Rhodanobacteraceae bacterium]|nr:glycosyltransferase [Rhodanobacteraceae bacterium]